MIKIALAGNPNCGKTTMFNSLTGANQYVGNWPGVTVEKKEGKMKGGTGVIVTDLPGIYSLSPYTPEEIVSRDYLSGNDPSVVLNLVDATNIERNLYLTTQILELGKPVVVLTILPKASEDAQLKHNAWQTLSKFTKMFNEHKIDNIITVDNAKIESLYSDVGPFNFFPVSNKAIVEPLHAFNVMSRRKDEGIKVLDSTEFGKLFVDGKGFTVYGQMAVSDYENELAIATAIVESLKGNLLASGFNIKQARYAGFMLVAPERIWNKIPSSSLDYAQQMINDVCDSPLAIFYGIYKEESSEDFIKVYSMFSGLGLPTERIDQLKEEAQLKMGVAHKKDEQRQMTMKVDVGEETVNKVDEIKRKIEQKTSSFNKLHSGAIIDRRKK